MDEINEQRREQRLRYHWLIQFARSVKESLSQGRMVDVSSSGAAFVCYADKNCPSLGKLITTRFSVPRFDSGKCFDTVSFNRIGRVCRVHDEKDFLRRVAIRFTRPLPFKPGEQPISKHDRIFKLVTSSDGITTTLGLKFNPGRHCDTTEEALAEK